MLLPLTTCRERQEGGCCPDGVPPNAQVAVKHMGTKPGPSTQELPGAGPVEALRAPLRVAANHDGSL